MRFSSAVTVENAEQNAVFSSVSLYIPSSLAEDGIVGWAAMAGELTATQPVVLSVTVNNFSSMMKGNLLSQWSKAFNDATNIDLVLYLIVFDDSLTGSWVVGAKTIDYPPLTAAFSKLFFISYMKMIYDFNYDGEDIVIPFPGTYADMTVTISNPTGGSITLPAGEYLYDDGDKVYELTVLVDMPIAASGSVTGVHMIATTVGADATTPATPLVNANFTPVLPGTANNLVFTRTAFVNGQNANPTPPAVTSYYFDQALALAYLCTTDVRLSYSFTLVKLALANNGFPVTTNVDPNECKIRSIGKAGQLADMLALNQAATLTYPKPRTNLFWGALRLIDAANTCMITHSEFINIFALIIGAWMVEKNPSGEYVGNKLSKLRLTGTSIKPFGYPSVIDSAINVNDAAAFDSFDEMNIGYLSTISDLSLQDSMLSAARSVTGFPVSAQMISKWVDYWCSQDAANMIADDGTLTDPTLTDNDAYIQIQNIVKNRLGLMSLTRRLQSIRLLFPSFDVAKVSSNALVAASAWRAQYIDDLDSVTVTGGITA